MFEAWRGCWASLRLSHWPGAAQWERAAHEGMHPHFGALAKLYASCGGGGSLDSLQGARLPRDGWTRLSSMLQLDRSLADQIAASAYATPGAGMSLADVMQSLLFATLPAANRPELNSVAWRGRASGGGGASGGGEGGGGGPRGVRGAPGARNRARGAGGGPISVEQVGIGQWLGRVLPQLAKGGQRCEVRVRLMADERMQLAVMGHLEHLRALFGRYTGVGAQSNLARQTHQRLRLAGFLLFLREHRMIGATTVPRCPGLTKAAKVSLSELDATAAFCAASNIGGRLHPAYTASLGAFAEAVVGCALSRYGGVALMSGVQAVEGFLHSIIGLADDATVVTAAAAANAPRRFDYISAPQLPMESAAEHAVWLEVRQARPKKAARPSTSRHTPP